VSEPSSPDPDGPATEATGRDEGLALLRAGRPAEAVSTLQAHLARSPTDGLALRLLSIAHHQLGRGRAALEAARSAVVARPDDASIQYQLGITAFDEGSIDEARQAYERAVQLRPGLAAAWTNLGRIHDEAFRFDQALACYERSLALAPEVAVTHANLGNTLLALERYAEAQGAFERAVAVDRTHAPALLGLSTALAEQGRVDAVAQLPLEGTPADRGALREHVTPWAGGDVVVRWFEGRHRRPEWLAHEAEQLGRRVVQALDDGAAVDGPVGLGFCPATLRPEGQRLVVCVPDLRRDPVRHRTSLASFYLQAVVMAGVLAAQVRHPPALVSWLQTVRVHPDALDLDQVALVRHPPTDAADSGWRLAPVSPRPAEPLRLPISVLVKVRPMLTRPLTLPVAWSVVMEGDRMASVRDASGQERLSTGPDRT